MVSITSIAKVAGLKSSTSLELSGSVRESGEVGAPQGALLTLTLKKGLGGGVTLDALTKRSSDVAEDFRTLIVMFKAKCSEVGKISAFSADVETVTFLDGRPREVVIERHGEINIKMKSKSDASSFKDLLLQVCAELHIKADVF